LYFYGCVQNEDDDDDDDDDYDDQIKSNQIKSIYLTTQYE